MSSIIDRRKNSNGKSTGNREKFLKRIKGQIKKSLPDVISNQSIKDIGNNKGKIKKKKINLLIPIRRAQMLKVSL